MAQTQHILMVPAELPRGIAVIYDREADGRVIAEVPSLPGVMAYGATEEEAGRAALALALHVIADRMEHGE
jgi:predicted RNase H-like HicB family nuclease